MRIEAKAFWQPQAKKQPNLEMPAAKAKPEINAQIIDVYAEAKILRPSPKPKTLKKLNVYLKVSIKDNKINMTA